MDEPAVDDLEMTALRAQDLLREGALDEAESLLRSLPAGAEFSAWLHEKVLGLIALAEALSRREMATKAAGVLSWAESEAAQLERGSVWEAADAYVRLSAIWRALSEPTRAEQLLERGIELSIAREASDVECRMILSSSAKELAQQGRAERARAVALSISYAPLREVTLAALDVASAPPADTIGG